MSEELVHPRRSECGNLREMSVGMLQRCKKRGKENEPMAVSLSHGNLVVEQISQCHRYLSFNSYQRSGLQVLCTEDLGFSAGSP